MGRTCCLAFLEVVPQTDADFSGSHSAALPPNCQIDIPLAFPVANLMSPGTPVPGNHALRNELPST